MKTYKPTSPGRRGMTGFDFNEITPDKKPEKKLLDTAASTGGRNNYGRITSRFRGGGHKQRYRIIDFKRNKTGVPAKVASIEYDPNRTCRIALLQYADGENEKLAKSARNLGAAKYLAPAGLNVYDVLNHETLILTRPTVEAITKRLHPVHEKHEKAEGGQ